MARESSQAESHDQKPDHVLDPFMRTDDADTYLEMQELLAQGVDLSKLSVDKLVQVLRDSGKAADEACNTASDALVCCKHCGRRWKKDDPEHGTCPQCNNSEWMSETRRDLNTQEEGLADQVADIIFNTDQGVGMTINHRDHLQMEVDKVKDTRNEMHLAMFALKYRGLDNDNPFDQVKLPSNVCKMVARVPKTVQKETLKECGWDLGDSNIIDNILRDQDDIINFNSTVLFMTASENLTNRGWDHKQCPPSHNHMSNRTPYMTHVKKMAHNGRLAAAALRPGHKMNKVGLKSKKRMPPHYHHAGEPVKENWTRYKTVALRVFCDVYIDTTKGEAEWDGELLEKSGRILRGQD